MMASAGNVVDRLHALEAAYRHIADTRMAGVPVLNPRLQVQALGFEPCADEPALLWGILLTPWFMNLLRLPVRADVAVALLSPGQTGPRDLGPQVFDFIGAELAGIGRFEQCSLFSPMFEFEGQAAAVATAHEVLQLLRPVVPKAPAVDEVVAARRGFLFGRSAAARR